MRWSLRTQIVVLVSATLVTAMSVYLLLASSVITGDKEASVYEVNALIAGTVAQQVGRTVTGIADKLRYFGQEWALTPGDAERRARSLFDADDAVLSLEVFKRGPGGWERAFLFVDNARLAELNLTADDLAQARKRTPAPLAAVEKAGLVLQNASLAPDLALVRLSAPTVDGNTVVIADLRPEWLLAAVQAHSVYRVFLVDRLGHVLAHPDGARVIRRDDLSELPVVHHALSGQVSRGAEEYEWEDEVRLAAFARVENGIGSVVVEVPRGEVFKATRELSRRSLLFAVGVGALALLLAVALGRRVTQPLNRLLGTMQTLSRGEFGAEVNVDGPPEIRAVGAALNDMSRELATRSQQLQETNAQLVQSEKLSAVGELAASVAHEVKNPMVGIVGFAQLGRESTDVGELHEYFKLIEQDALRANKILQSLLEFSRPPEAELDALAPNDVVQGSLALCVHQLQMYGVTVETALAEGLPEIRGNSNQLRQVMLNLLMNAGHAVEDSAKKLITVTTAQPEPGFIEVRVADTGPGLAEEVKEKLFKPFFTTRRRGQGTGLGLSVSRTIIEAHRGSIRAEGGPGEGATFIIRLPAA